VSHLEARLLGRTQRHPDRRQLAVGKDVALDERRALLRRPPERPRDPVVQEDATRTKHVAHAAEVLGQELLADVLEHADARDLVERPSLELAVVAHLHAAVRLEPRRAYP